MRRVVPPPVVTYGGYGKKVYTLSFKNEKSKVLIELLNEANGIKKICDIYGEGLMEVFIEQFIKPFPKDLSLGNIGADLVNDIHDLKLFALRIKYPMLRKNSEWHRNLLLLGPDVIRKSMIAEAIASFTNARFFYVSCTALVTKWGMQRGHLLEMLNEVVRCLKKTSIVFVENFDLLHEFNCVAALDKLIECTKEVYFIGATNRQHVINDEALKTFKFQVSVPLHQQPFHLFHSSPGEDDQKDAKLPIEDDQKDAKIPVPGKRNVLITSALPEVSNVPNLGSIIYALSADVFARFCRQRGYNAIYISGTADYGTATEMKAIEEKCTPEQIRVKYHAIHKEIYEWFHISFVEFGRTSSSQQTEVVKAIFKKLLQNSKLSEKTIKQHYCETCKKFLADRLMGGTCKLKGCNSDSACGDQCETCGNFFSSMDLIDPRCKVCRNIPEIRDTNHLCLELPSLKDKLEDYIDIMSTTGSWNGNAIRNTRAWLKQGLKVGVPVPLEKFKEKVLNFCFDALIGHVSITSCYTPHWEQWWKNTENVELYHFMGTDNEPFDTVRFPSTLNGTDENWTILKTIRVIGERSISDGMEIFGSDAKYTNIPVEVFRYYLLTSRSEVSGTLFTWHNLQAKHNEDLLNNLGKFINQVLSFIAEPEGYGSCVPDAPGAGSHELTKALAVKVGNYVKQYLEVMEMVDLKQGLNTAMSIASEGNSYLQDSQIHSLYTEDRPSCSIVMRTAVGLVSLLAGLLEPFMPSFAVKVLKQLNWPLNRHVSLFNIDVAKQPWEIMPAGHKIGTPEPLFTELKDEDVAIYRERFARSLSDRAKKIDEQCNENRSLMEKVNL